jgi:hypothetical protein
MTRHVGWCCIALVVLSCSACEGERLSPAAPSAPSVPPAAPGSVTVRVEGRVIDADREEPAARAAVRVVSVHQSDGSRGIVDPGWTAISGEDGVFGFNADLPVGWRSLGLAVEGEQFETTATSVTPTSAVAAELRLLRRVTIRPGESIEMRVFLGSSTCGFESYLCRRVFLESSTGESVNVEVIPADSERDVGLFAGAGHPVRITNYPRRVTVTEGEVWIYPGAAERTGIFGVFDQKITLIAHRASAAAPAHHSRRQ